MVSANKTTWGAIGQALKDLLNMSGKRTNPYVIINTNTHTVNGYALHAISDTVIDTIILVDVSADSGSLNGKTVKAGDTLFIPFTSIKLTSGEVVVYQNIS